MANYPSSYDNFRDFVNLPGIVYDPDNTKTLFAEDLNKTDEAVSAIEHTLGLNPQGGASTVADRIGALDTSTDGRLDALESTTATLVPPKVNLSGSALPNGNVTAPVGSIYTYTGTAQSVNTWYKRTGTGNTGWVPIAGASEWNFFASSTTVTEDGGVWRCSVPIPSAEGLYRASIIGRNSSGSVGANLSIYFLTSGGAKINIRRYCVKISSTQISHVSAVDSLDIATYSLGTYGKYNISFEHNRETNSTWGSGRYQSTFSSTSEYGTLLGYSSSNAATLNIESSTLLGLSSVRCAIWTLNTNLNGTL